MNVGSGCVRKRVTPHVLLSWQWKHLKSHSWHCLLNRRSAVKYLARYHDDADAAVKLPNCLCLYLPSSSVPSAWVTGANVALSPSLLHSHPGEASPDSLHFFTRSLIHASTTLASSSEDAVMNTRPAIDESNGPVSLSVVFNQDSSCFAVGLDTGFCGTY